MCTIGENNTRLSELIDRTVDMGDVYPIRYIHMYICTLHGRGRGIWIYDLRLGCPRAWMHAMMTYVDPASPSALSFSKTSAPPRRFHHIDELHRTLFFLFSFQKNHN